MSDYHVNKQPITLEDCKVKQASQSQHLEVMVKKFTNIIQSPKKIMVDDIEVMPKLIMLRDLDQYEKVDVKAKAIKVGCKVQVGNGKMKQDVIMADVTRIGRHWHTG